MTKAGNLTVTAHGDREIVMTRVFDAPRHLVFDAHTQPELVKRWLGVRGGWTLAVCEIDLRPGGKYRYVWREESKGIEMGMGGVYREIVRPERIACTEQFDDAWYSGEALSTLVLLDDAGKTTLTLTVRYESSHARDGVLKSGMERGVAESYDVLAEILASMGAPRRDVK
jgi:uncharacterized protein YndB with AHSA1/START domain